jgi:hypothetical protein
VENWSPSQQKPWKMDGLKPWWLTIQPINWLLMGLMDDHLLDFDGGD